ncbi:hypothetical protein LOTGIDRAFT_119865 [Lottia gigantea]|uniref:M-phase inducer phosphatase n=1 Tax=Lottia gigantea TaxID=225164 RepID=V4A8M1_LOTGI|nr:hypothetical protein LOTGIDRAFT_119865 [Lottia gigantea]ESO93092.1 hypothetical protein LOTGIDRAFT_119865 [Lottia gigantea]
MDDEMSLIGDGSTSHVLPTINGKNKDLVSISHETMADVLNGVYEESVQECTVIDCRYPYEYEGGHIQGALNLYTQQQISEFIKSQQQKQTTDSLKHILVFHCEFSSERGPKLLRYLRSLDRKENSHRYPYLDFPEIYILEKGYKVFSENQMHLCEPQGYTPMLHKDYSSDLRRFRIRSKSWTEGERKSKIRRSLMSPY